MKGIVDLSLDPDRLTFVASQPDFDTPVDLEDEFASVIGIGFENPFDTPEHLHEDADPARAKQRVVQEVAKLQIIALCDE